MQNFNKILSEENKSLILENLMKDEMTFSSLLRKLSLRDHGQLNYHLKQMLKEGLILKKNGKYKVTSLGEKIGVYINQFQSKEMYSLSVVCAIIKNENEEILFLKRAKNPQRGKWGFPGGKLLLGERIKTAAEREVFEETKLKLKAEKIIGFYPSIVYNKNEISYHANIIPVVMGTLKEKSDINLDEEHDDFKFINIKNLHKYDLIANNELILKEINSKDFCFNEIIVKE